MLLIYPPVVRSTEAPLGIARLAGFLKARGLEAHLLDLNHEGLEYMLASFSPSAGHESHDPAAKSQDQGGRESTWTSGAILRKDRNLAALRNPETYRSPSRYSRAVGDLNRVLKVASAPHGSELSLANYVEPGRSPLRREDLMNAAAAFMDNIFFPLFSNRINEELARGPVLTVGLSINYLSQALPAFAILAWLAAEHPSLKRIAGGGLISSWMAQGAVTGDDSFDGLVHALLPGRGEDGLNDWLGCVKAPAQHPSTRPVSSGTRNAPIPAELPDFNDFRHLDYLSPVRILPFSFSSGCPWKRCSFCPERAEDGRYVGIHAGAAVTQLAELLPRYTPGLIHFTDNEISPLYLRALTIHPPGIPWYGFARFSGILLDSGFCRALADSGCRMLQLGLESADQQVLDAMGKGTRLAEIDRILENLAAAGIGTYLYVLFGTPSEDLAAARKTSSFLTSHARLIDFLNIAIFNLPAASTEAASLVTRDFYEGALSLYREFEHPAGWNRDKVRAFIRRELESIPEIRNIINRTPPVFTSNHAVFFLA